MKWSEVHLKTLRDKPAGAETPGHILLCRGGYISPVSSGIFIYNTFFLRSIHKLSAIIREEMEREGAVEILMPVVQPKNLWLETGRWDKFQSLLMKTKSRSGREFCLGPTHEEVVTSFARSGIKSFRDMPFNIYQIQTKFRDEIRPRFGLLRAREFLMKDAYSFDRDSSAALKSYKKMFRAYSSVFRRLAVEFVVVRADTGMIGGSQSEEFHIPAETGEDVLLVSENFSANREICPSPPSAEEKKISHELEKPLEELATPGVTTIRDLAGFLKCKPEDTVKILFVSFPVAEKSKDKKQVGFLCRGDDEINLLKVCKFLGCGELPVLSSGDEIRRITGADPGSCGPVGLKIPLYVDHKLKHRKNFITGANKDGFHLKNVNFRDFKPAGFGDFCLAKEGNPNPEGPGFLKEKRGIEVGHLFYLSDTYSGQMGLKYPDEKGKSRFVEMGCYGLGVTRTLQAVAEQSHDENGLIWPVSVAPFILHVCLIDPESRAVRKALDQLVPDWKKRGWDYFIDDRSERPGVKFKDADLLGLPLRLSIGERDLRDSRVELTVRKTLTREKVLLEEVTSQIAIRLKSLEAPVP